jgi:hypothetical protein
MSCDIHLNQRFQNMLYPSLALDVETGRVSSRPDSLTIIQTLVKAALILKEITCFKVGIGLG